MSMPLSEGDAIERALSVANDRSNRADLVKLVLGSDVPDDFGSIPMDEQALADFVADLKVLARSDEIGADAVRKRLLRTYGMGFDPAVVAIPVVWNQVSGNQRARSVQYRVIAPTVRRAFGYVLSLLLDDSQRKTRMVRRCHLDSCGKFFLQQIPDSGQAAYKYCPGTDHQSLADRKMSARRQKMYREREKLKRELKRGKR